MASSRLEKHEGQQLQAALNLLKRLPPQDLEKNLANLAKVAPHLEHSLAAFVSKPSRVKLDPESGRWFIACEFNLDGTSYRSPWTNKYVPTPDGDTKEDSLFRPPERLRRLEESYNEVFDAYKTSYYEGGVSSVYLWDLDEGFAAAFLIRKEIVQSRGVEQGVWDIMHIVEVKESPSNNFSEYKLWTTLLLHLEAGTRQTGQTCLGGYFTRQMEDKRKKAGEEMHLQNIGRMIEETEITTRQALDSFYMAKSCEIMNIVRSLDSVDIRNQESARLDASRKP
mmetsp:Transcript_29436/g.80496  ORF Transcript_29436/g.80496 Transcript_29436/m.80496 type:complete len:281 (+) Transcript_29436:50-892(+)